jgi:hypothetical protein
MTLSHQDRKPRPADPIYRRLQRLFAALCLLLAPLAVSLSFATCPIYGNPNCPGTGGASVAEVAPAFRDANPLLLQLFFGVTVLAAYIFIP